MNKRFVLSALTALALVATVQSAQAYLPSSHMILSRMVRQAGKGAYSVDQDVTFTSDKQQLVLHEHWIIENAELMRVTVTNASRAGVPVHLEITYRGNKRTTVDAQGQPRTVAESAEFMEPYLYTRTSATLLADLLRQQVLPRDFVSEMRAPPKVLAQTEAAKISAPETYVQLERVGGTISFALGEHAKPGMWIDQDSFLLRRIRWPSQAEMQCDRAGEFPLGLKLPRERTVTWGQNTAMIHLTAVRSVKDTSKFFASDSGAGDKAALQLPELASVKEFYSRFR